MKTMLLTAFIINNFYYEIYFLCKSAIFIIAMIHTIILGVNFGNYSMHESLITIAQKLFSDSNCNNENSENLYSFSSNYCLSIEFSLNKVSLMFLVIFIKLKVYFFFNSFRYEFNVRKGCFDMRASFKVFTPLSNTKIKLLKT